jgi:hypothetical protein
MQLMTKVFQNLFPSINVTEVSFDFIDLVFLTLLGESALHPSCRAV